MSAESTCKRLRVNVKGIVQGVGFRPFVFQLAVKFSLGGFVLNNSEGVIIEIEGNEQALTSFLNTLKENPPPLARVDSIDMESVTAQGEKDFSIRHTDENSLNLTMVSPDIALCEKCEEEMKDPSNRRYGYPFINCTDCGPRYSIIKKLPYDRPYTSMREFHMCQECAREYNNPLDRRYHAQPISCPDCGPALYLLDKEGKVIAENSEAIRLTCKLIREKKILAVKGLGGFHLVCDATSDEAVSTLRERKKRPSKPLAVMFQDIEAIKKETFINDEEEKLILCKEHPVVVVNKNSTSSLSLHVAPNIERLGVFLPYTPLHVLLLDELNTPIVATSANLSDEPIVIDEKELLSKLGDVVDAVLSHDREIVNGCDDSVIMQSGDQKTLVRMARGYAPKSMLLPKKIGKKILAVGANQKNSIALAFDDHIILSPHIGDLNSIEAFEYFTRTLETFKSFYEFEPDIIVCDKHPEYETTKWAKGLSKENPNIELFEVQHHYAHALACMMEYTLDEKVLAFCFDGTGYGDDGTLWGAEVLIADTKDYERVSYLTPFRLLGATKAVREPRRVGLSLLFECFTLEEVLALDNETTRSFMQEEIKSLHVMWQKGLNSPLTSSMGRLFDAVASLSGIAQILGYEGESGLLIESVSQKIDLSKKFSYTLEEDKIDIRAMIAQIVQMKESAEISAMFISTIANIILDIADQYPSLPVVLSGGVFQNKLLVDILAKEFKNKNIRYYMQQDTPVNDGSIALGQAYYALKHLWSKDEK